MYICYGMLKGNFSGGIAYGEPCDTPKVSQGLVPDSLRDIECQIDRLERYANDIVSLLVTPAPAQDCRNSALSASNTLACKLLNSKVRITDVVGQLEYVRGILSEQLGQDMKLI